MMNPKAFGVMLAVTIVASVSANTTGTQTAIATTDSSDDNKILQRSTVTSKPVVGGVAKQDAVILLYTENGTAYEGVLTYTTSKPVVDGHILAIDNATCRTCS